jgi:CDP-paratose 2-epimerase
MSPRKRPDLLRPVLITGGAGFIGTNLAHRLAKDGRQIIVYDNLSRAGTECNLSWLKAKHGEQVEIVVADVRDTEPLQAAARRAGQVFHLAAQVAVTTSLSDPVEDFSTNVLGTLNLLEAIRTAETPPPLLFTSTNKVYGTLNDIQLDSTGTRYMPRAEEPKRQGLDEHRPLNFHSPYGCSKGAADQYVLDYARSYGLSTAVFRMSCIYGPHQNGTEDQGWVAHFLLRAIAGESIAIYGDGMQVRDVLHVDDLISAFLLAEAAIDRLSGQAFNIGGGPVNALSLLDLIGLIAALDGRRPGLIFGTWRTGDQRYYVSDHEKFTRATGWEPRYSAPEGVAQFYHWLLTNRPSLRAQRSPARVGRAIGAAVDPVGAAS